MTALGVITSLGGLAHEPDIALQLGATATDTQVAAGVTDGELVADITGIEGVLDDFANTLVDAPVTDVFGADGELKCCHE